MSSRNQTDSNDLFYRPFLQLVYGIILLPVFHTLFCTTREMMTHELLKFGVITRALEYHLWYGQSGWINAFILSVILLITYFLFFVFTQMVSIRWARSFTISTFAIDILALIVFYAIANSLLNYAEKPRLQPDNAWLLFFVLHLIILVRIFLLIYYELWTRENTESKANKSTESKTRRQRESSYRAYVLDMLIWNILSVGIFGICWLLARYPLQGAKSLMLVRWLCAFELTAIIATFWLIWYWLRDQDVCFPVSHFFPLAWMVTSTGAWIFAISRRSLDFLVLITQLRESQILALVQCGSVILFSIGVVTFRSMPMGYRLGEFLTGVRYNDKDRDLKWRMSMLLVSCIVIGVITWFLATYLLGTPS